VLFTGNWAFKLPGPGKTAWDGTCFADPGFRSGSLFNHVNLDNPAGGVEPDTNATCGRVCGGAAEYLNLIEFEEATRVIQFVLNLTYWQAVVGRSSVKTRGLWPAPPRAKAYTR
jgi:hypothetical protein